MVQRRVIADSDDSEDELGIEEPVQSRRPGVVAAEGACAEAPAMEPLSSQRDGPASSPAAEALDLVEPGSNADRHASDSTDASFFNRVRNEQRRLAQQNMAEQDRANLVENIVKMSQKASGSSSADKIPFTPLEARGKVDHVSSATDITSPSAQLLKARSKRGALAQVSSASEVTTPRSNGGTKDEWDVPSSPEDGHAPKGTTSHGLATSGKRKRDAKGQAGLLAGGELEIVQVPRSSSDRPAKKGKNASSPSDESVVPDTGNFYIAPSTLTPSQKKQYHRIQPSSGEIAHEEPTPDAGMQLPLSKPKSSCATTVAVSTPSRYAASSGPRPSWELPQSPGQPEVAEETASRSPRDMDVEGRDDVIDLVSSPDIIASGNNRRRPPGKQSVTKLPRSLSRVDEEGVQPVGNSPSRRASRKAMDDNDELGNDEEWDSDEVGFHREEYRPRKSRRRGSGGGDGNNVLHDVSHDSKDELMGTAPPTEHNGTVQQIMDETPRPINPPKSSAAAPAGEETPQPKKRGRKKKQPPVPEEPAQDEFATGLASQNVTATEPVVPGPASEPEPPIEKPKKKRGRPRKSDTTKAGTTASEEKAVEEPALEEIPPTQPFDPTAAGLGPAAEEQPPTEPEISATVETPSSPDKSAANKGTAIESPSAASSSTAPGKATAAGRSIAGPSTAGKPQQPLYRVGLSKKSRVASLLKVRPRP